MQHQLKKAAFFGRVDQINRVYKLGRQEQVAAATDLYPHVVGAADFEAHIPYLQDLEVIFSTWGMPSLTEAQIAQMPRLRAVFYAAGSVQGFARPFLEQDVLVVSAWAANAVPVAEFTLAQVLLAGKGYFANTRGFVSPDSRRTAYVGPGNFGEAVALLGCGQIGRAVVALLEPFHLRVVVFDPFLTADKAQEIGVVKVSLEEAFAQALVVSNHLANLPETVGMLRGAHFAQMRPHATFINTGRGQTVAEDEMCAILQARPDLTALLDVTHPEPPAAGSALYALPNVHLTTHIAGSTGDEVVRMADYMVSEFHAWEHGRELCYAVTREMLSTMA